MQHDDSAITGATPTGRPRRAGSRCCSTEAKNESQSTKSAVSGRSKAGIFARRHQAVNFKCSFEHLKTKYVYCPMRVVGGVCVGQFTACDFLQSRGSVATRTPSRYVGLGSFCHRLFRCIRDPSASHPMKSLPVHST